MAEHPQLVFTCLLAMAGRSCVSTIQTAAQPRPCRSSHAAPFLCFPPQPAAADACGAGAAAADPPQPPASPPRKGLGASAHLRVLNWLVPGVAFLVIGHLASHAAAPSAPGPGAGSGPAWGLHRAGAAFGTIGAGGGPVVVSACGAPGGGGEAVQLVFANYRACAGAGGRGGCGASDWSTSSGWSDGYSA